MRVHRHAGSLFGLRLGFATDPRQERELATQEIAIVQSTAERTS
jgi:hypothetical protein